MKGGEVKLCYSGSWIELGNVHFTKNCLKKKKKDSMHSMYLKLKHRYIAEVNLTVKIKVYKLHIYSMQEFQYKQSSDRAV